MRRGATAGFFGGAGSGSTGAGDPFSWPLKTLATAPTRARFTSTVKGFCGRRTRRSPSLGKTNQSNLFDFTTILFPMVAAPTYQWLDSTLQLTKRWRSLEKNAQRPSSCRCLNGLIFA
jgi:hypothetical protein